jgi:pimeloyl-ACP methyl ester carboxylesterase
MNKRYTLAAAEKLKSFDKPALLVWAPEDRFFPIRYAERLEQGIPDARLVRVPDARTFVSLDQPQAVADAIAAFMREKAPVPA